jgi:hypothetical protein
VSSLLTILNVSPYSWKKINKLIKKSEKKVIFSLARSSTRHDGIMSAHGYSQGEDSMRIKLQQLFNSSKSKCTYFSVPQFVAFRHLENPVNLHFIMRSCNPARCIREWNYINMYIFFVICYLRFQIWPWSWVIATVTVSASQYAFNIVKLTCCLIFF